MKEHIICEDCKEKVYLEMIKDLQIKFCPYCSSKNIRSFCPSFYMDNEGNLIYGSQMILRSNNDKTKYIFLRDYMINNDIIPSYDNANNTLNSNDFLRYYININNRIYKKLGGN